MAASTTLARCHIKVFIRSTWIRRLSPAIPYLCALGLPVGNVTGDLEATLLALPFAVLAPVGLHYARRRQLKAAFNPRILTLMPPESATRRWSESAFYLLPAVFQEILFRGILYTFLVTQHASTPVVFLVVTFAFIADHLLGDSPQVRLSLAKAVNWITVSTFWTLIIMMGAGLWVTILSHMILNLPAAVLPHLRGQKTSQRTGKL